jgi:N-acetylated-alpha-linked acidic dipeptidase
VRSFQARAEELDHALDEFASHDPPGGDWLARINDALTRVERAFLLAGGLPGRPWFKHAIYAPGVTTGYGAWPLPAIREAIEEQKTGKLGPLVDQTVAILHSATAEVAKVRDLARNAKGTVAHPR